MYDSAWLVIMGVMLALASLAALIWLNVKTWHLRHGLQRFHGSIRDLAGDKHQQVKMVNTVLAQLLAFSTLSLLPKMTRLPLRFGRHLLINSQRSSL